MRFNERLAKRIRSPSCQFLIMSPERASKNRDIFFVISHLIRQGLVNRIIVDECHVILTWGATFRQSLAESVDALDEVIRLAGMRVPRAYYTATIPESDLPRFQEIVHAPELLRIARKSSCYVKLNIHISSVRRMQLHRDSRIYCGYFR